ncbi:DUF6437 family protein [Novosphingobium sp. PASSN1]|uniref:DUF6437 family protein n=1 Tax=Novosphingobium sp. PASSN1 TaxID=2015561 RepID=UPI0034566B26
MGATILSGSSRQNGGAPSSLTRTQRHHHAWPPLRENLPTSRLAATIGITVCPLETQRRHGKIVSGGVQRPDRKDPDMARSKPSARDALLKLRAERDELVSREARLREEAAADLGKVLLDCGAEVLEPAQLKQLLRVSMTLGIDTAIKRLSAT